MAPALALPGLDIRLKRHADGDASITPAGWRLLSGIVSFAAACLFIAIVHMLLTEQGL